MKKSELRLLLNAEPFGYGPAAAIATFFPHLHKFFSTIGYVGKGHTLDLQRHLPYDKVHDLRGVSGEEEQRHLANIFSQYDILLTATDFGVATAAKRAGLHVIIYDPLTWYWPKIPKAVREADLYIAQDFIGVRKRLKEQSTLFPTRELVPSIVERVKPTKKKKHVLINLGGLQNPFLKTKDLVAYARLIIESIKLNEGEDLIISTSSSIASDLRKHRPKAYSREEMKRVLSETNYAFMTPGLGNVYEAAAYGIPTVWLPPTNDSQGQQAALLQKEKLMSTAVDWKDITGDHIDYFGKQQAVLRRIATQIRAATRDTAAQMNLVKKLAAQQSRARKQPKASRLLARFGTGGAKQVTAIVHRFARSTEN